MKTIVLTGCSRGLGRALAEAWIGLGHTLLGCARSPAPVAELAETYGEPHCFQTVDVADDGAVAAWARHLLENYGPPDLLVNNAALINGTRPLWDIPPEEFDAVIDVNVKGTANVLRHFLPAMTARKKGVIVNLSSGWGRSTSPEVAPYCASKYAIEGLTLSLAQELPAGMAAIPLNPGIIDTDMLRSCWAESAGAYPQAAEWAKTAAAFILKLGPKDNGKSLDCP